MDSSLTGWSIEGTTQERIEIKGKRLLPLNSRPEYITPEMTEASLFFAQFTTAQASAV
jgi:hypothetical protein